jgi:transposase-like protein
MTSRHAPGSLVDSEEESMKQQRKITDELDAQRCLAAARRAGGGVGAWARANGVDGRSLNAWRMNLARRGLTRRSSSASSPTKAPVHSRAAVVELIPAPRSSTGGRYAVHVGATRVEFGDDFDPATLRRIVEALRAC